MSRGDAISLLFVGIIIFAMLMLSGADILEAQVATLVGVVATLLILYIFKKGH